VIAIQTVSYLTASILFILALSGLSSHENAKKAVVYGVLGMTIAVVSTILGPQLTISTLLICALVGGSVIGLVVAYRVEMTGMPQLVAALHSFVGLAAVLISVNSVLNPPEFATHAEFIIHEVEVCLGAFIGAVTFTGSIIAFGKLSELISGKALTLPGRHLYNLAILVACGYLLYLFIADGSIFALYIIILLAFILGVHLVMAIGGADMPVVVSMLNSYSGWAAAATGFLLGNDLLIVTGALVGASGAILSYIMCKAMNRSFISVIMGGFGGVSQSSQSIEGEQTPISSEETADLLSAAKNIIIVPGYGMAVAQAQASVKALVDMCQNKGAKVRFAIHPVAGRLPGHMNVLLAEAKIPYDIVYELDEINADFADADAVLVIGSNDIVNPSAIDDPNSPIAGMPVLEVWQAETVIVFKRGQGVGYSGIENPLFYKENTRMLFGDAKKSLEDLSQNMGR